MSTSVGGMGKKDKGETEGGKGMSKTDAKKKEIEELRSFREGEGTVSPHLPQHLGSKQHSMIV